VSDGGDTAGVGVRDVSVRDIPADRKQKTPDGDYADASQDTFIQELTVVAQRHEGPLTRGQIVQTLFDFADSYATVECVDVQIDPTTDHEGNDVALARFPDQDDLLPSPLGNWDPDDIDDPDRYDLSARGGRDA
jgi:hypothetical protein